MSHSICVYSSKMAQTTYVERLCGTFCFLVLVVRQVKPDVPYLQLSLQIIIKATPNKICLNKPMDGAVLISVVTALREFDAVYNLGSSLLSKFILDPKVEDYRILPNEAMNEDKTV